MKKIAIGIGIVALLSVVGSVAFAAVTQTSTNSIAADLPRDKFYEKVGQAVHDLCETDIPAIIVSLNGQAGTNEVVTECLALSNQVLRLYISNLVVKAGGTVTVPADSIASASIAGGYTRVVTNSGTGYTNLWVFTNGIFESYTTTGTMP